LFHSIVARLVACLLFLFLVSAHAQEAPATPVAPQAPPVVAPAEPVVTEPVTSEPGAAESVAPEDRRSVTPAIVVLPPEFVVYQQSVGATEPVPEWTQAAQANLHQAAAAVLSSDGRFELRTLPDMDEAQRAQLREHVELFKVISMNIEGVVKLGGKPWQSVRDSADFRVGDGLAFLREASGADYAFVMSGAEIRQTGGSIFMQLAIAGVLGAYVPGGGTYMYAGIVDLRNGQVTWYNSSLGVAVFGMGGAAKTDQETGAAKSISTLFNTYPASPGLTMVAVEPAAKPETVAPQPAAAPEGAPAADAAAASVDSGATAPQPAAQGD
jgi:hypothetical protein